MGLISLLLLLCNRPCRRLYFLTCVIPCIDSRSYLAASLAGSPSLPLNAPPHPLPSQPLIDFSNTARVASHGTPTSFHYFRDLCSIHYPHICCISPEGSRIRVRQCRQWRSFPDYWSSVRTFYLYFEGMTRPTFPILFARIAVFPTGFHGFMSC